MAMASPMEIHHDDRATSMGFRECGDCAARVLSIRQSPDTARSPCVMLGADAARSSHAANGQVRSALLGLPGLRSSIARLANAVARVSARRTVRSARARVLPRTNAHAQCGVRSNLGADAPDHADQRRWMIARMFPSESLNHAALAPPAVVIPFASVPGKSYFSKETPRRFSSATSASMS